MGTVRCWVELLWWVWLGLWCRVGWGGLHLGGQVGLGCVGLASDGWVGLGWVVLVGWVEWWERLCGWYRGRLGWVWLARLGLIALVCVVGWGWFGGVGFGEVELGCVGQSWLLGWDGLNSG